MKAGSNLDCLKTLYKNDCQILACKGTAPMSVINIMKLNAGIRIAELESLPLELPAEQRFGITKSQAQKNYYENKNSKLEKKIWQLIYYIGKNTELFSSLLWRMCEAQLILLIAPGGYHAEEAVLHYL